MFLDNKFLEHALSLVLLIIVLICVVLLGYAIWLAISGSISDRRYKKHEAMQLVRGMSAFVGLARLAEQSRQEQAKSQNNPPEQEK